jgi:hypothetical protein
MEELKKQLIRAGYLNEKCALHFCFFVSGHFSEWLVEQIGRRHQLILDAIASRNDFPGFIDTEKETPPNFKGLKNSFILGILGSEFSDEDRMRLTWVFIICVQVICQN